MLLAVKLWVEWAPLTPQRGERLLSPAGGLGGSPWPATGSRKPENKRLDRGDHYPKSEVVAEVVGSRDLNKRYVNKHLRSSLVQLFY